MAARKGLLGPAAVVNQTSALLHNPDVLMQIMQQQSLLGARPLGALRGGKPTVKKENLDPFGLFGVKPDRPWTAYPFTRVQHTPLVPLNVMTPHDFYMKNKGGSIVGTAGDKADTGTKVISIGGNPVSVVNMGGGAFQRLGRKGIWAAGEVASNKLSKQVEEVQREHKTDNVLLTHASMGPTGIDFSHHAAEALVQQLPYTKISSKGEEAIAERMAKGLTETSGGKSKPYTYPDFPGIYSKDLPSWLAASGVRRKHFVQLMDNKDMVKAGVPLPGVARLATSDIEQLGVPLLASGMHFAEIKPGVLTNQKNPNPAYPAENLGKYHGSLGRYVPIDVMFHDWWKDVGVHLQNPYRSFAMGGGGADRAQKVNQPWLDQLMQWWNR